MFIVKHTLKIYSHASSDSTWHDSRIVATVAFCMIIFYIGYFSRLYFVAIKKLAHRSGKQIFKGSSVLEFTMGS